MIEKSMARTYQYILGFSTILLVVKRLRKEKFKTDTQSSWPEKRKNVTFFLVQKGGSKKTSSKARCNVSLNKQVQTCKFTKEGNKQTGVLTCQNSHKLVTHSCPEACADGLGLQARSHRV